jgi:hypothetical protein
MYRNLELLRLARKAPHCMGCPAPNDGTVVAAHSNQARDGKGMAIKASDARVAFLCMRCHSAIDQGAALSQAARVDAWEAAHRATMGWLIESGNIVVRPAEYVEPIPAPKRKKAVGKGPKLQSAAKIPSRKMESRSSFQDRRS